MSLSPESMKHAHHLHGNVACNNSNLPRLLVELEESVQCDPRCGSCECLDA